jgi:hypothetical protein
MNRMVVASKVGSDGILHLNIPIGVSEADQEVRVTIEPIPKPMTQEQWRAWVQSMAGSWQGNYERPPQGDYERREPLSSNTSWIRTPGSVGFDRTIRRW